MAGSGKIKWLSVLILELMLIAGIIATGIWWYSRPKPLQENSDKRPPHVADEEKPSSESLAIPAPPKILNLYPYEFLIQELFIPVREAKEQLYLRTSLKLRYSSATLTQELKDKKGQLEILLKYGLSEKYMGEFNADSVRRELLAKINRMLKSGKIEDLVFTDFRIELK